MGEVVLSYEHQQMGGLWLPAVFAMAVSEEPHREPTNMLQESEEGVRPCPSGFCSGDVEDGKALPSRVLPPACGGLGQIPSFSWDVKKVCKFDPYLPLPPWWNESYVSTLFSMDDAGDDYHFKNMKDHWKPLWLVYNMPLSKQTLSSDGTLVYDLMPDGRGMQAVVEIARGGNFSGNRTNLTELPDGEGIGAQQLSPLNGVRNNFVFSLSVLEAQVPLRPHSKASHVLLNAAPLIRCKATLVAF